MCAKPMKDKQAGVIDDSYRYMIEYGDLIWSGGNMTLTASDVSVDGRLSRTGASSGTMTIDTGSNVFIGGAAQLQNLTITLDGLLYLGSDAVTSSAPITGSGTLRLRGDFQSASAVTLTGDLEAIGKLPQTILGSDAIHAGNVKLDNSSRNGITLTNTIYYSGTLEIGETAITGSDKVIKEEA